LYSLHQYLNTHIFLTNVCFVSQCLLEKKGAIDGCSKLINYFEISELVIDDCYNRVSTSESKHRLVTLVQLAMDDKKGCTLKVTGEQ
jgi:hypothetical protein